MQYDDYDDLSDVSAEDYYDLDADIHSAPLPQFTFAEQLAGCTVPTTHHFVDMLLTHLATNLLFAGLRLVMGQTMLPTPARVTQQALAMTCGSLALRHIYGQEGLARLWITVLIALTVFTALGQMRVRRYGFCMAAASVCLLLGGEWFEPDALLWHRMRGSMLIVAMKVVSVAFEVEWRRTAAEAGGANAEVADELSRCPSFMMMAGYVMTPATCVFGPWTPFEEYAGAQMANWKSWMSWSTFFHIFNNTVASYFCLIASNCLIGPLLIADSAPGPLVAYRDAMSFRFSHYFVAFLGQTLMLAGGTVPTSQLLGPLGGSRAFGMSTTEPWLVEVPRSLVRVVVVWNRPMHYWLKTYVFRAVRPYGTFAAICATYTASAVLHGLNFQLAAVLLSLGFFTYVEHHIRARLAQIFNACVLAVACPPACGHRHKWLHPYVMLFNVLAAALTVWHLAYLGQMFISQTDDSDDAAGGDQMQEVGYSYAHTLAKWSSMGWSSHVLMAVLFVCFKMV